MGTHSFDRALRAGQYKPRTPLFRVERVYGRGYVVIDKDGGHVSGIERSADNAETVCARMTEEFLRKTKRQDRACITCGAVFPSDGIHNRMCQGCRHRSADGWDPHGLSKRSGRPG
jgi:hypothetical protein